MNTAPQYVYVLRYRPDADPWLPGDPPITALQKLAHAEETYRLNLQGLMKVLPEGCEVLCGPLADDERGYRFDFVLAHGAQIDLTRVEDATVRRARGELFFDGLHVHFASRDNLLKLGGEAADALLAPRHGLPCEDPSAAWHEAALDWARDRLPRAAISHGRRRRILRILGAALRRSDWTRLRIMDLRRRLDESIVAATLASQRLREELPTRNFILEVVFSRTRSPWERSLRMVIHALELLLPRKAKLWVGVREDDELVASIQLLISGRGIDPREFYQDDVLVAARPACQGEVFVSDQTILHVGEGGVREFIGSYAYEQLQPRHGEIIDDPELHLWARAHDHLWNMVGRRIPDISLDEVDEFTRCATEQLNQIDIEEMESSDLEQIAEHVARSLRAGLAPMSPPT